MKENANPDHYGRPNLLSHEVTGTLYYTINTGDQNDFSHVNITFETSGASATSVNYQSYSVSAWTYPGLIRGNSYRVTLRPEDKTGNIGDPISWSWSVVPLIEPAFVWSAFNPVDYDPSLTYQSLYSSNAPSASQSGSFLLNPVSGSINAGTHPVTASFKPSDDTVVNSGNITNTITVNKDVPVIVWADYTVPSGQPLSSTQLNAQSSVPGIFTYEPPSGTVLVIAQSVSAFFVPTDTTNYTNTLTLSTMTPALPWNNITAHSNWNVLGGNLNGRYTTSTVGNPLYTTTSSDGEGFKSLMLQPTTNLTNIKLRFTLSRIYSVTGVGTMTQDWTNAFLKVDNGGWNTTVVGPIALSNSMTEYVVDFNAFSLSSSSFLIFRISDFTHFGIAKIEWLPA